jgi:hypothetical protein
LGEGCINGLEWGYSMVGMALEDGILGCGAAVMIADRDL